MSQRQSALRSSRVSTFGKHNQRHIPPGSGFSTNSELDHDHNCLVPPSLTSPEEQSMIFEQPIDISTAMLVPEVISMGDTAATLRQSLDSIEAATSSLRYESINHTVYESSYSFQIVATESYVE